jgi:branched-chain amino acid transport system ATP-binding protein
VAELTLADVHTYYGDSHVLHGVSLAVGPGEVVAILGRNGMGKTTLIRSVVGFTPPRRGSVIFDGRDVTHWSPSRRITQGMALVPQGRRVFVSLSVRENLAVARGGGGPWSLERVYELFPRLRERARNRADRLSGGEQQMLAIGRALMSNPRLLLMDEPTEGLAPLMVKEVRDVLAEINRAGVSVLLVEHNIKVALSLAHRVYLMGKAHIGFAGTVQALKDNPAAREKYLEV